MERTFTAFFNPANINLGFESHGSLQIDLANFTDVLKAEGAVLIDNETIHYHAHVTDNLAQALNKLAIPAENCSTSISDPDLDGDRHIWFFCYSERA